MEAERVVDESGETDDSGIEGDINESILSDDFGEIGPAGGNLPAPETGVVFSSDGVR